LTNEEDGGICDGIKLIPTKDDGSAFSATAEKAALLFAEPIK
jgi:hypothetical protein